MYYNHCFVRQHFILVLFIEKKSTKTFSESNPVYDEPVHDNIQ